jgi:hypothetical protein
MLNCSDVFISYAHLDNESAEGMGFISRLKNFLKIEASKKYGKKVILWWDADLAAGTRWEPEIYNQLSGCRIFLAIISPSWTNSHWAGQEWTAVWNRLAVDEALGTQTRIIPVAFEFSEGFMSTLPEQQRSLQFRRYFRTVMSDVDFRTEADALAGDISRLLIKIDGSATADVVRKY